MERNCFKSVERISTTAVVDTHHHSGIHADISTIITLASPSPLRLSPHRHFFCATVIAVCRAVIPSFAVSNLTLRLSPPASAPLFTPSPLCPHARSKPSLLGYYDCHSTLGITTAPTRAVNLTAVNNCLRAAVYSTLPLASPLRPLCKSLTRHPYAGSRHF